MTWSARDNLLALFAGESGRWIPCCPHISNANNLPQSLPAELLREPLDFLEISRFVGGDLLVEVQAHAVHHEDGSLRQESALARPSAATKRVEEKGVASGN